jgi:hypothetical protein
MTRYLFTAAILTIIIFTTVAYMSCTKTETETDKCANVTCQNGGTCSGGICYCKAGYTGTYCEKKICEEENTARVRFENKSGTSLTYTVVWDGVTMTTLSPGSVSEYFTVAAGQHTMHFMIANSTNEACTVSEPVLLVCKDHSYYCTK